MKKEISNKSVKNIKRTFTKKKYAKKNKKLWFSFFKFFLFLILSFFIFWIIAWLIFYQKYIIPLPPVENLQNMSIDESSTIYDRNWKELYKIFKEKRTYVDYNNISKNMINAIVAWEDKRFWTTPWFDIIGITRSILVSIITWHRPKWTSWISQQLMKVTYLSNARKIERKIKELRLSWKLNKVFDKKKILELYLNKIFFGSNSYWIEQAANTFFWVKAKDLNVLESSILASLPKAPSWLSPYNHKDKLLWFPYIYEKWKEDESLKLLTKKDIIIYKWIVWKLIWFINQLKFKDVDWRVLICWIKKEYLKNNIRIDNDWCSVIDYEQLLDFLNSIKIKDGKNYIEYQTWRKDYILWRMLEDKYITFSQYKKALLDSFWFRFKKYSDKIKYPYFVMYVKDYLEKKYWKDVVEKWWLNIYTTLDAKLQDKAISLIKHYWDINIKKFGAKNDALISIDNKSWWILSMVWWRNYFDTENWWNNNMILSRLQPGSTFKPFVYSLAIKNNKIWTKTPVYDLKTIFPSDYSPQNFDGKFMWKIPLDKALDNSRNIPAIKMFFLSWWERVIIDFMEKLWVKTLADFKEEYRKKYHKEYVYWASMALWTWLMTPLELAWAYSVFANLWRKVEINPILKIVDSKWNIIEDNTVKKKKKVPVINPALAYIMNSILTDTSARPKFWNTYMTIPGRKLAAKTWTSTKQFYKNWVKEIYPRNLWTIWYTPQITTVVWVWNTDWEKLYYNWNWLEWAWPIMRDYMAYAHKNLIVEDWKRPAGVKELNVSNVSWLLPSPDWFPKNFLVSSLFLNSPTDYDNSLRKVSVDTLCNWKVTSNTPKFAIKKWYLLQFHSLQPNNPKWENPVKEWVKKWDWKKEYWNIWNVITSYNDKICNRTWKWSALINWTIIDWEKLFVWENYVEIWFKSTVPISKLYILLNNDRVKEIPIFWLLKWVKKTTFNIPEKYANRIVTLSFVAVDNQWYSYKDSQSVTILWHDIIKPIIKLDWPNRYNINSWDKIDISWKIIETSKIRSLNYYIDWKVLKLGLQTRKINYVLDTSKLTKWTHIFKIEVFDHSFNQADKNIILNIR